MENDIRIAGESMEVRDICVRFRRKTVLDRVSFKAVSGDCVGILGINGSGKSTLLSVLAGILKPSSGSFTCSGHEMMRERRLFPRMIAYLPQENPLMEDLSALDNLKLWYGKNIPAGLPVLDQLLLREMLTMKVKDLSGGMKRRLSIACAVCENQRIMILDEPTSSLDLHQKEIIRRYVLDYTGRGGIAVMSTHDEQEIRMCTSLYYLSGSTLCRTNADEAVKRLKEG